MEHRRRAGAGRAGDARRPAARGRDVARGPRGGGLARADAAPRAEPRGLLAGRLRARRDLGRLPARRGAPRDPRGDRHPRGRVALRPRALDRVPGLHADALPEEEPRSRPPRRHAAGGRRPLRRARRGGAPDIRRRAHAHPLARERRGTRGARARAPSRLGPALVRRRAAVALAFLAGAAGAGRAEGDGGRKSPRPVSLREARIGDRPTRVSVPVSADVSLVMGLPEHFWIQCPRNVQAVATSLDGDGLVLQYIEEIAKGGTHALLYLGA